MVTHHSARFGRDIVVLHPGDYYATKGEHIISTVLGSCVAVALFDSRQKICGLNHFMLPEASRDSCPEKQKLFLSEGGKYGMYAMDLLVNEMIKGGSSRHDLVAKVFGGANVLRRGPEASQSKTGATGFGNVATKNIEFALSYLETERIPVQRSDVGGTAARKILVFTDSFRVLLKRITGSLITVVKQEESAYVKQLRRDRQARGEATLF